MGYLLAASVGLFALYFIVRWIGKTDIRTLASSLRWIGGGVALFLGVILSIGGRAGIGSMLAFGGVALLRQAWQQRHNSKPLGVGSDTVSTVRSRYIRMQLDHDTGEVWGEIVAGSMKGTDLDALDEDGTRHFIEEITGDADSVSLLETYLDANRAGWREYLGRGDGEAGQTGTSGASGLMDRAQALEILGLSEGATAQQIREAHRSLMKKVHPDAGGSTFLAARINEAKDFLLADRS
ncbi:molecular chaperone DnaJ [Arsenicitalea aurantiaca]|uniref:Molecular chaperone DnaJ n=1 Tax=Arsenicitalea aurantiaca TaxID=1783274 RepID=A0A433X3G2_9HYPH|nr:DnaJ domain-containing protein [Arsenicitalea aurantiaca]RUT28600.1 molecular chaperone DnaJ [Arsenicitalea aurantiaca]